MGKCQAIYREVRFIYEDDLTQVYILIDAVGDCPLGVQGWHHKTYPATKSAQTIMAEWVDGGEDFILWPQAAPQEGGAR